MRCSRIAASAVPGKAVPGSVRGRVRGDKSGVNLPGTQVGSGGGIAVADATRASDTARRNMLVVHERGEVPSDGEREDMVGTWRGEQHGSSRGDGGRRGGREGIYERYGIGRERGGRIQCNL